MKPIAKIFLGDIEDGEYGDIDIETSHRELGAMQEIENLQAMYDAQCQCADERAEKYRAEVERKADASLLARIAELEQALGAVNARLADAQAVPNAKSEPTSAALSREVGSTDGLDAGD